MTQSHKIMYGNDRLHPVASQKFNVNNLKLTKKSPIARHSLKEKKFRQLYNDLTRKAFQVNRMGFTGHTLSESNFRFRFIRNINRKLKSNYKETYK